MGSQTTASEDHSQDQFFSELYNFEVTENSLSPALRNLYTDTVVDEAIIKLWKITIKTDVVDNSMFSELINGIDLRYKGVERIIDQRRPDGSLVGGETRKKGDFTFFLTDWSSDVLFNGDVYSPVPSSIFVGEPNAEGVADFIFQAYLEDDLRHLFTLYSDEIYISFSICTNVNTEPLFVSRSLIVDSVNTDGLKLVLSGKDIVGINYKMANNKFSRDLFPCL